MTNESANRISALPSVGIDTSLCFTLFPDIANKVDMGGRGKGQGVILQVMDL